MTSAIGKFFHYFNIEEQKQLVEKFQTTDKKELKDLMKQVILHYISKSETTEPEQVQPTKTLDDKIKKLRVADLTLKVWDKLRQAGYSIEQLQEFVNTGKFSYPENKTFYAERSETEIQSNQIQVIGKTITHQPDQILQEDGTLRCKLCNKKIEMRAFNFEQLDDYRIHFESNHRKLNEKEREKLLEIYEK